MRFQQLDLNLLVVLDALLTERSVTLAAERVFLSQSATSSALARLRKYFGDDLLILKGRQMILTARGEAMIEPVHDVLEKIRTTVAVSMPFNPATSDRTIRIMASDYSTEVLLSTVLPELTHKAPHMRFEIQPMNDALIDTLERGMIDLLITIDYSISPDHPSKILFEDDYVVVGWDQNPALKGEMTSALYFEMGHVMARFGKGHVPSFEDWFVRKQSQTRRIEVVAPSFLSIFGLVIGSGRIATVHRRLAVRVARYLPLVIREVPIPIPVIREAIQWNIVNSNDAALSWVVDHLVAIAFETKTTLQYNQVK